MNDAILLQHAFVGRPAQDDFSPLAELTHQRNIDYCNQHGFDYDYLLGYRNPRYNDPFKGEWTKVEMVHDALKNNYKYVVWLDVDTVIKEMKVDLREGCPKGIGVCWHRIPQFNHWNTGAMYIQNSQAVKNFISEWLVQFPGEPPWMEQGIFNRMAMQSNVVQTISDRWNSTLNYSMVPDAVVLGYHGNGLPPARLELMKATLKYLEAKNG